jgi:hypothetical protein
VTTTDGAVEKLRQQEMRRTMLNFWEFCVCQNKLAAPGEIRANFGRGRGVFPHCRQRIQGRDTRHRACLKCIRFGMTF